MATEMKELIKLFTGAVWDGGPLVINPDTFLDERENILRRVYKSEELTDYIVANRERAIQINRGCDLILLPWLRKYNHKIPSRWLNWMRIDTDLKASYQAGLEQPDILRDAAASHPIWYVRKTVGTNQLLDEYQLAAILIASQPAKDYRDITEFQLEMLWGNTVDITLAYQLRNAWFKNSLTEEELKQFNDRFCLETLKDQPDLRRQRRSTFLKQGK